MDLSSLQNLFDIEISPEIGDITLFYREGDEKVVEETNELHLNVAELEGEEREEVIELADEHFDVEERVLREPEEEETEALEQSRGARIDETVSFFDGVILDRHVSILEKSLYLNALIETEESLTKPQIDDRRSDIAERLGQDAFYISSLCSAGYFDEGRELRELYDEIVEEPNVDDDEYREEFEKLVNHELLAVFVSNHQTVYEVTNEVRGTLARHQREDPAIDFLDIRGIGDECRTIIDSVVENLEDEFEAIDYERCRDGEELIVRIQMYSIDNLLETADESPE